ncbi:kinase-like protein [Ramaria rubella]|nr:kinase-like protein [Ramaria rubella]
MAAPVAQHPLEQYDALDIIGNGSFGIIRKVRRKSDGVILARKELNFERMTERDRKQIVAEVNILKDLCHENIVRYHDRYVDRDNGILYILMEYCGGGDLGTVIKNCTRVNRPLPEDTIWNYFLQILLALQHCHFPTAEVSTSSSSSSSSSRQQILHRDLKPENVFLDANQVIKLGDFGLSKALGAASFANTYVGTPYYMSPELMQEKSYDTKSDIWSLGCLIYELCALKPPFHEAKTHNELSIFIRNGRIPPLPRGYSQALHQVIKAMLNVNPAMRPSAQQLLSHERLELVSKVHETEKMLNMAKAHKQVLFNRERDILLRERQLQANEASFQQRVAAALTQQETEVEAIVATRVAEREAELRQAVMRTEEEVRDRMEKREAELLQAVMTREQELRTLWERYEISLREELRGREEEVKRAEDQLKQEWERLGEVQCQKDKVSEEQHPIPAALPTSRTTTLSPDETPTRIPVNVFRARSAHDAPIIKVATPASAMRGVVLTDTGEVLATPAPHPVELARLVLDSPRIGLNFRNIFDRGRDYDEDSEEDDGDRDDPVEFPSTSKRRTREQVQEKENVPPLPTSTASTRLRKPSIRASLPRPPFPHSNALCPPAPSSAVGSVNPQLTLAPKSQSLPVSSYDLDDEENLPSPFLKRFDLGKAHSRRGSSALDLRAKAAANAAIGAGRKVPRLSAVQATRPSLERAKQASEDAKKALFRP